MIQDNIPETLKNDGLFCTWAYRNKGGKITKVPYNPRTGAKAKANDPGTFGTYDEACTALRRHSDKYSGIGLGLFDDLVGVDIDHCYEENGALSSVAQDFPDGMASYAEQSPSGKGIHMLVRDPNAVYASGKYMTKNTKLGVEIYAAGQTNRYFTITGDRINEEDINDRGKELVELAERFMRRSIPQDGAGTLISTSDDLIDSVDDVIVIDRMVRSANGEKIKALMNGDWEGTYPSQSEAEMALCNHLAFFTRKDIAQMDRIFRSSSLMRPKWDEQRGQDTYGAITLKKAVDGCDSVWTPGYRSAPVGGVQHALEFLRSVNAAQNERYRRDDIGAGYLLADYMKPFARPVGKGKTWMAYDGVRWSDKRGEAVAEEAAKDLSRALSVYAAGLPDSSRDDFLGWAGSWAKRPRRKTFLQDAASVYPVDRGDFDRDLELLNLNNGTLDLRTMELRDHDPEDLITQVAPVDYDPSAVYPRWDQFVQEIMEPGKDEVSAGDPGIVRAEKSQFLQRFLGYCLSGDTSAEAFLVMYGPSTRNGKGTCVETVRAILGCYAKSVNAETLILGRPRDGSGPSEDVARLVGVRMASVGDIQQGARLDSARMKLLTGGDTLTARFLGENSFEFKPQFKLIFHTNHLPVCSDVSIFNSGRVMVLPFSQHFEERKQDKSLKHIFREPRNQSAILNWLLEGLRQYRERGLDPPQAVVNATAEYQNENDIIFRFVDDVLEEAPQEEIRSRTVYEQYIDWCRKNNLNHLSSHRFMDDLKKAGIKVERKRPLLGGEKTTVVVGFRLNPRYLY